MATEQGELQGDFAPVQKAAGQGDALAQLTLGLRYALGRGVLWDDAEAVRWYRLPPQAGVSI